MALPVEKQRAPKGIAPTIAGRMVRMSESPISTDSETPLWILSTFDYTGPWGEAACINADCATHLGHLKSFESMTWAAIQAAAGGRSSGTNSHFIETSKLSRAAKVRLVEIKMEDTDTVFSLRLQGAVRLYGIRDGRVLKLLWLDPWHDDPRRAVCPAQRHHT